MSAKLNNRRKRIWLQVMDILSQPGMSDRPDNDEYGDSVIRDLSDACADAYRPFNGFNKRLRFFSIMNGCRHLHIRNNGKQPSKKYMRERQRRSLERAREFRLQFPHKLP